MILHKVGHCRTTSLRCGKYLYCTTTPETNSANYCVNLFKRYDFENFLCGLLIKGEYRRSSFAIRAFNVEIARITDVVSDDKIGAMRLKFWDQTIDKLFDKNLEHIPDQPVIKEIKLAIDKHKLSKMFFKRLIKARTNTNLKFVITKQLEEYAEQSVSSIYYLLLEAMNIKNVHADHAASHLGKAQGITNLLRSIPYQSRRSAVPIPQEILMNHGVSQERILRNKEGDKGVEECIFHLASIANQHLEKSRALHKNIPKETLPIFLPGVAVSRYLERLRRANFHLTHKSLLRKDTMLPVAFYWNNFRGKF